MKQAIYIAISVVALGCSSSTPADTKDVSEDPIADINPDSKTVDAPPSDSDANVLPIFTARPNGQWYAADFHVHATGASNDTGGDSTPDAIKQMALARGLDIVVLTDHSNSTGSDPSTTDEDPALFNMGPEFPLWDDVAALSNDTFLMIDGNEISPRHPNNSIPTGHFGCVPRNLDTFDPTITFTDRPMGDVATQTVVNESNAAGCYTVLNHPYGFTAWVAFDWRATGYAAMEVYNGSAGWDDTDTFAVTAWACDNAIGTPVTAIGGSDNHRVNIEPPGSLLDPPLAQPKTFIFATALTWPDILTGLENGAVSVADSPTPLQLDAHTKDGTWAGAPGVPISPGPYFFRVTGDAANTNNDYDLFIYAVTGCNDTREPGMLKVPEPNWDAIAQWSIPAGETFEFVIPVEVDGTAAYFAWLRPTQRGALRHGVQLTNMLKTN